MEQPRDARTLAEDRKRFFDEIKKRQAVPVTVHIAVTGT